VTFPQVLVLVKRQVGCFGLLSLSPWLAHHSKQSEQQISGFCDKVFKTVCEVYCASSGKIFGHLYFGFLDFLALVDLSE
jgi:hypothetical protein